MARREYTEEEIKAATEHRDMLLDVRAVLATSSGKNLFKYLFKHFEVAALPEDGLDTDLLHERIGILKAGNSIFKLACEANFEIAAELLAKLEKERYDAIYAEIGQG